MLRCQIWVPRRGLFYLHKLHLGKRGYVADGAVIRVWMVFYSDLRLQRIEGEALTADYGRIWWIYLIS
jgi:hypothetical protein